MRTLVIFAGLLLSSTLAVAQTGVKAHVNLSPTGNFEAKTDKVEGHATLKNGAVSAKGVSVPLNTLTTGIELRDHHMKEKYLEVGKFPKAELIEATGKDGKAKGKLKIRGIEKEVEGTYSILDNKELEAKFPIKLSDYKIEGIRYLGVGVKDDVDVAVTLPLVVEK